MDEVAGRFGTLHFDVTADAVAYDRRMWSADRLHPSERGHRYIAGYFHDRLAAHGQLVGPRPAAEPTSPPPTRYDTAAWMATKGTAWVLRRSTDLLPYLLVMALRERWPGPGRPPPRTAKPATAEPATAEPATAEPATAEPATAEPATVSRAAPGRAGPRHEQATADHRLRHRVPGHRARRLPGLARLRRPRRGHRRGADRCPGSRAAAVL